MWWECETAKKWSFGRSHFSHNFVTMSWKEKFIEINFVMNTWPDAKSIFQIMVVFFYFTLLWKCDENVMSLFTYSFFGSCHLKFPPQRKADEHSQQWSMIIEHWSIYSQLLSVTMNHWTFQNTSLKWQNKTIEQN